MIEIKSKYDYNEQLKTTYKYKYETDKSNLTALHQYILCLIKCGAFIDRDGFPNEKTILELLKYLSIIVNTSEAEPYEVLFYYEINRAFENDVELESWLKEHPEYSDWCLLDILSFDILLHIGLYDAALKCCQDIYNATLITYVEYMNKYSNTLISAKREEEAFNFLKNELTANSFFFAPHIYAKVTKIAIELNKQEEMLSVFRAAVERHPYIKWVSREYVTLCLELGYTEEANTEYERLLSVAKHYYDEAPITSQTMGLFQYFCSVRKLLGMTHEKDEVATEFGFTIQKDEKQQNRVATTQQKPWENDFLKNGGKPLLRRVKKMNKPFRTYCKLFAGGEKEMIFAKSIFGNYISAINNKFHKLFGENSFQVTDYDTFYDTFPFYELNGFTEDEIDEASTLLNRIKQIAVQLNPFVSSRSYPINHMMADLLSINTEVNTQNKTLNFEVVDTDGVQITVFGVILFLMTFLNKKEKEAFSFELCGGDPKLTNEFIKQIAKTLPPSSEVLDASNKEMIREVENFTSCVRKELLRILLEIECQILKEFNQLDSERPNINAKYFNQMLSLKYEEGSLIFNNLMLLHHIVINGIFIGEYCSGVQFTIGNIIKLLQQCEKQDPENDLFRESIESLFTICVNKKYYNHLKKQEMINGASYLVNRDKYCKRMLWRCESIMTPSDEEVLYAASREHIFTAVDDAQRDEFSHLFGSKRLEWAKIDIEILKIDSNRAEFVLNTEKQEGEYCTVFKNDNVTVEPFSGCSFNGWNLVEEYDSPIAKFVLKEAILKEEK